MSKVPPVASLPPISSIQDPAVRAYLQALDNGWKVRNGDIGDGKEKFLTYEDLESGVLGASRGMIRSGTAGTSQTGRSTTSSLIRASIADIMQRLSNAIMSSYLWKKLSSRIDWIERPAWFKDKYGAEVKVTEQKIVDGDRALASQLTQVVSAWDANWALSQQKFTALTNADSSQASSITTLQTQVGSAKASAEEALSLSSSVSGKVNGSWTVKFDVNGYVVGAGLGLEGKNGNYSSNFIVRADNFSVWHPTGGASSPFIVSGGVTYINYAMINQIRIGAGNMPAPGGNAFYVDSLGILRADNGVFGVISAYNVYRNSQCVFAETSQYSKAALYGKSTRSDTVALEIWNSATGKVFSAGGGYAAASLAGQGQWKCTDGVVPFTGIHEAIIAKSCTPVAGDIVVESRNVRCQNIASTISEVMVSTSAGQRTASGVFNSRVPFSAGTPSALWDAHTELDEEGRPTYRPVLWEGEDFSDYDVVLVNAIGDGQINVCGEGGNIAAGDFITTSSTPGKGMKQPDDIVRACTVARAREAVTFDTPAEVKTVACFYMCG